MSPVRIAISGSAGTGKTTLSKRVADTLGIPHSSDQVRETLAEMRFSSHRQMDITAVAELCQRVIEKRIAFENGVAAFVADTSTVDNANFWLRRVANQVDERITSNFVERCRTHATTSYSTIVLLPFGAVDFVDDGVRTPSLSYQAEMQSGIEKLLQRWTPNYRALPPEVLEMEKRVEWVLRSSGASGESNLR